MKRQGIFTIFVCFLAISLGSCSLVDGYHLTAVTTRSVPVKEIPAPLTSHPGWTSYTNSNQISDIAFDKDGNVWTVGGGLVKWDVKNNTYTKFLPENGLPTTQISSIAIAPDNSLWVGGAKLSRFDGQTWATYDEKRGAFLDIAPNGDVWTLSEGKIFRFDGQAWTTYPIEIDLFEKSIISFAVGPNDLVLVSTFRNGDSWLSVFDGKKWKTYSSDYVHSIAFSSDGETWLGTWRGIEKFNAKTGKSQLVREFREVSNLVVAPDDKLWFSVCASPYRSDVPEGVWSFDGKTWRVYTSEDNFISCGVSAIAAAPNGDIWLGTSKGLSRLGGKTWPTYATKDTLAGNRIDELVMGEDGVPWVLFNSSTVWASHFQNGAWKNYEIDGNPAPDVRRIGPFIPGANGTAWYGSNSGAMYFDGQTWSVVGLNEEEIRNISIAPDGTVWFGTYNSVASFRNGWEIYKCGEKLSCTYINDVEVSPDGSVWVNARDKGILHFDGKQWTRYKQFDENRLDFFQFAENGDVWGIQPETEELVRFDGKEWIGFAFPADLKASDVEAMIATPNGGFWFLYDIETGREFSLHYFDGQKWELLQYPEIPIGATATKYSPDGDISEIYFYYTFATTDGGVWITANHGALYFDGRKWTAITTDDGLLSNSITSIVAGPDGTIWFGTNDGISRFSPP